METPVGEEDDSHLGDFIRDDHIPVPDEAATFSILKEQLVEVLSTLTDREQRVLRLRFGLFRLLRLLGLLFAVHALRPFLKASGRFGNALGERLLRLLALIFLVLLVFHGFHSARPAAP